MVINPKDKKHKVKSKVIKDTLNPTWDEELTVHLDDPKARHLLLYAASRCVLQCYSSPWDAVRGA